MGPFGDWENSSRFRLKQGRRCGRQTASFVFEKEERVSASFSTVGFRPTMGSPLWYASEICVVTSESVSLSSESDGGALRIHSRAWQVRGTWLTTKELRSERARRSYCTRTTTSLCVGVKWSLAKRFSSKGAW